MVKFPYVEGYNFGQIVEIKVAEELLREYNDFFLYNQDQLATIFNTVERDEDDEEDPMAQQRAEQNAKAATDRFSEWFGSQDFAKSAMVGLRIVWDDVQQILLEEYRKKTPIDQSAMNFIAPRLRAVCSVLLFAEYLNTKLGRSKKEGSEEVARAVSEFFTILLEKMGNGEDVRVPEFSKSKKSLEKLKTLESILGFVKDMLQ